MSLPGHHLARWLVRRGHHVAYLSAPVSPWHFADPAAGELARRRWNLTGPRGRWLHERLFTWIPRTMFPIHRRFPFDSRWARRLCTPAAFPGVQTVLAEAGFLQPDVLRIQNLQLPGLLSLLGPKVSLYAMEDNIAEFPELPRTLLNEEHRIVENVDAVTVTAESLRERAEDLGAAQVISLPNGVDFPRYRRPETPPPPEESLPGYGERPVAIYVGALDAWFDAELLAAVARHLPAWNFVLIGPPRRPFEELRRMGNVYFLGPRPPRNVPPLLWQATCGMIPFRRTELIESVRPLKLYEYLAAGLPVVSTAWREMELLDSPAALCNSAQDFAGRIYVARKVSGVERRKLVRYARDYSWNRIFTRFYGEVKDLLKERL